MLEGEKGCLSKDEIVKSLREIKYQVLFENDNVSLDTKVLDLMIDRVANVFANRIPKQYNYDFNRLIAGLMGATCYMPDTFEKLNLKPIENILGISTQVEDSGHHSTFGHSFLTLEISGIPKALAMVLNNEKENRQGACQTNLLQCQTALAAALAINASLHVDLLTE